MVGNANPLHCMTSTRIVRIDSAPDWLNRSEGDRITYFTRIVSHVKSTDLISRKLSFDFPVIDFKHDVVSLIGGDSGFEGSQRDAH